MNAFLSAIGTVKQYEGISCINSTRFSVLSLLQKLQPKGYPSACASLNIPWNLSITKTINEIQDTTNGQGTWQQFHSELVWAK